MKNSLFALIMCTLISCGGGGSGSSVSINPPSWIIGKWLIEGSPTEFGWKFTNSTFIEIPITGTELDWGAVVQLYDDGSLTDELSGNTYSVFIQTGGSTATYSFKKITNTKIEWLQAVSTTYFIKQ